MAIETLRQAREFLERDGGLTPGCPWGSHSSDMVHVAWALACLYANAQGTNVTDEILDESMGLVVNGHPDVESLLRERGPSVGWALDGYELVRVPWAYGDEGKCSLCGVETAISVDYLCEGCHDSEDI